MGYTEKDTTRSACIDAGALVAHFFCSKDLIHHLVEAGSNELRPLFWVELHHSAHHRQDRFHALGLHLL